MTDLSQLTDALGTLATELVTARSAVTPRPLSFDHWRRGESSGPAARSGPYVPVRLAPPLGAAWLDDFEGTALDPAKWWRDTIHDHPAGTPGGMSVYGQFSSEPRLYNVAGSILTLCSLYVSGTKWWQAIISTRGLFTPALGIWRAAVRWDRGHAITGGWWFSDPNDQFNEIDPLEFFPEPATPRKYSTNLDMDQWFPTIWQVAPVDSDTAFHMYEVEITASEVIYRCDGVETARRAAPYSMPALYCLLTTQVGIGGTYAPQVPDATTPLNPRLQVDWVGWWPNS